MDADRRLLVADTYFDGTTLVGDGPFSFLIQNGRIKAIERGDLSVRPEALPEDFRAGVEPERAGFLMPGLVEAHCHLFLDGAETDPQARRAYLDAPFERMLETGRHNVLDQLKAGITLARDAGDRHGVNHRLREEVRSGAIQGPRIRSPGAAIRKTGRYGGFMARAGESRDEIKATVEDILRSCDDLKIILTGIIDFEAGAVAGPPQFAADELALMLELARERGRLSFAHCSGAEGIALAIEAGVNSIEHGFFVEPAQLSVMADKKIAWVPTFAPVMAQAVPPQAGQWSPGALENMNRILDRHCERLVTARELRVAVLAGSDAGSPGVPHGAGLIDEMLAMHGAGLPMASVLHASTAAPRRAWGETDADLAAGHRVELVALAGSPFADPANLRRVEAVYRGNSRFDVASPRETA